MTARAARPPMRTPTATTGPRRSRRCGPPGNSTKTGIQNGSGLPSTHTDGSWSSGETRRLTPEQNTEATKACADIHNEGERVVLPAMRQIEAADPDRRLAGLEHMLKGADRLKEKIADGSAAAGAARPAGRWRGTRCRAIHARRTVPIVTPMVFWPMSNACKAAGLEESEVEKPVGKGSVQGHQQPVAQTGDRSAFRGPVPHAAEPGSQGVDSPGVRASPRPAHQQGRRRLSLRPFSVG